MTILLKNNDVIMKVTNITVKGTTLQLWLSGSEEPLEKDVTEIECIA